MFREPFFFRTRCSSCDLCTNVYNWTICWHICSSVLIYDYAFIRDVTDSESNGIRQFFINPKSDGYLKFATDSKFWFRSNSNVIFVNNHCGYYSRNKVE